MGRARACRWVCSARASDTPHTRALRRGRTVGMRIAFLGTQPCLTRRARGSNPGKSAKWGALTQRLSRQLSECAAVQLIDLPRDSAANFAAPAGSASYSRFTFHRHAVPEILYYYTAIMLYYDTTTILLYYTLYYHCNTARLLYYCTATIRLRYQYFTNTIRLRYDYHTAKLYSPSGARNARSARLRLLGQPYYYTTTILLMYYNTVRLIYYQQPQVPEMLVARGYSYSSTILLYYHVTTNILLYNCTLRYYAIQYYPTGA